MSSLLHPVAHLGSGAVQVFGRIRQWDSITLERSDERLRSHRPKRPYAFVVLAIITLIFSGRAELNTPTDILPNTGLTVGDVAHVYLSGPPQTHSVLVGGYQAVLLEVLKAPTLAFVSGVKSKIPQILRTLPAGVSITH
jgi:multidrug efflux pump subunit AcrB